MSAEFEHLFSRLAGTIVPAAAKKGMARAGMLVLRDSIMEEPMVPLDEGTLRGSGSVHVNGKPSGTSAEFAGIVGTPNTSPIPASVSDDIESIVGFNTEYATRLHEHPEFEFQHEGTGGKFLEAKLATHKSDYFQEVTDTIKAEMRKAQHGAGGAG